MESDWRVCRPVDGPRYFFHLPSQQVLWTLPPGIDETLVPLFADEDEQYVEEDKLESGEPVEEQVFQEDAVSEPFEPEESLVDDAPAASLLDTGVELTPSGFIHAAGKLPGSAFPPAWVRCTELSAGVAPLVPSPLLLHPGVASGYSLCDAMRGGRWERRHTASSGMERGDEYYVHSLTGEQSWVKPDDFMCTEELADVSSLLENAAEDFTLDDFAAAIGLNPLSPKLATCMSAIKECDKLCHNPTAGAASEGVVDGTDLTPLHASLLQFHTLLAASDIYQASSAALWTQCFASHNCALLDVLGSCLSRVSCPQASRHVCLSVLTAASRLLRASLRQFVDGRTTTFPQACGFLLHGIRDAVHGRRVMRVIAAKALGRDLSAEERTTTQADVHVENLVSWLQFTTRLFLYCAGAVSRQRQAGRSARKWVVSVDETCIDWQGVSSVLLDLISDACVSASPKAGPSAAVGSGLGVVVEHGLRALAALHRLFEIAVLDGDPDTVPLVKPNTSLSSNVDAFQSSFGIITPVAASLSRLAAETHALDAMSAHGTSIAHGRSSALAASLSTQLVHVLATTSESKLGQSPAGDMSVQSDFRVGSSDLCAAEESDDEAEGGEVAPNPAFPFGTHRASLIAGLSFTNALLELPATSKLLYKNDLRVLVDVILRELADLPVTDHMRICWLRLLKAVLLHSQWYAIRVADRYRHADICSTLASLFDVSAALASGIPREVRNSAEETLVACRDVLEE